MPIWCPCFIKALFPIPLGMKFKFLNLIYKASCNLAPYFNILPHTLLFFHLYSNIVIAPASHHCFLKHAMFFLISGPLGLLFLYGTAFLSAHSLWCTFTFPALPLIPTFLTNSYSKRIRKFRGHFWESFLHLPSQLGLPIYPNSIFIFLYHFTYSASNSLILSSTRLKIFIRQGHCHPCALIIS